MHVLYTAQKLGLAGYKYRLNTCAGTNCDILVYLVACTHDQKYSCFQDVSYHSHSQIFKYRFISLFINFVFWLPMIRNDLPLIIPS